MNCFRCKEKMKIILSKENQNFKYKMLECNICKSFGHIYYHPNTENIRKVEWIEKGD